MIIQTLFKECEELGASDIHIKEGEAIMLRIEWTLVPSKSGIRPDKILKKKLPIVVMHICIQGK